MNVEGNIVYNLHNTIGISSSNLHMFVALSFGDVKFLKNTLTCVKLFIFWLAAILEMLCELIAA